MFQDGFWKVDDLSIIGIDTDTFIDMLKNAGARSLGKFHCAKTLALKEKKMHSAPMRNHEYQKTPLNPKNTKHFQRLV